MQQKNVVTEEFCLPQIFRLGGTPIYHRRLRSYPLAEIAFCLKVGQDINYRANCISGRFPYHLGSAVVRPIGLRTTCAAMLAPGYPVASLAVTLNKVERGFLVVLCY